MPARYGKIRWPVILLLCISGTTRADMLAAELGAGIRQSGEATLLGVRYTRDWLPLERLMSFVDLSAGTWDGPLENTSVAAGLGLRYDLPRENYVSASLGLSYVSNETRNLGTHPQFLLRLALGHRFERLDFAIGYTHFSNGKAAFGWNGSNRGEDFISLQLGFHFGPRVSRVTPLPRETTRP